MIAIDNGHGKDMKGAKQSPDGTLKEGVYVREIAKCVVKELTNKGYEAFLVVPEDDDIKLSIRCTRVNRECQKYGASNCLCVSIHCNAAGSDGKWHTANGWSVFIAPNASNNSKRLANCLYDVAQSKGLNMRKPTPNQKYWVQSLAMCRDTKCPAVLTENLFQDNKEDVAYLLSDEGKQTIVDIHVQGIINYLNG